MPTTGQSGLSHVTLAHAMLALPTAAKLPNGGTLSLRCLGSRANPSHVSLMDEPLMGAWGLHRIPHNHSVAHIGRSSCHHHHHRQRPPNLVFIWTWTDPSWPKANQAFQVYFQFANVGTAQTGAFVTRIVLDGSA
jgi:hypothetical protein